MPLNKASRTICLQDIPAEPWARSAYLFTHCVNAVSEDGSEWIANSYPRRERLKAMWNFIAWHLSDGVAGDIRTLGRVWYFPWTECEAEMELAFAYAIAGLHRASIDHARRGLELVVTGAHFVADHVSPEDGVAWLESRDETPLFSRALNSLAKQGFGKAVLAKTAWRSAVQEHYWHLSDSVHVRGQKYSIRELQSSHTTFSGFPMVAFSGERLTATLDNLLTTGEHILVALAIANPVLLSGLPVSEKFGVDEPTGFFEDKLAAELRSLLPERLREDLVRLAAADPHVVALRRGVEALPSLSQEEIAAQINSFEIKSQMSNDHRS